MNSGRICFFLFVPGNDDKRSLERHNAFLSAWVRRIPESAMTPKLFTQVQRGLAFHYGDAPEHVLVKMDDHTSVCTHGIKKTDPYVLVFEEEPVTDARRKWIQSRHKPK